MRRFVELPVCAFAVVAIAVVAQAATVDLVLTTNGTDPLNNTWTLTAQASLGDNDGIAGYNVSLAGADTAEDQGPQILVPGFGPIQGFTLGRSDLTGAGDLFAGQNSTNPASLLYDVGIFVPPALPPPLIGDNVPWEVPTILAIGTGDWRTVGFGNSANVNVWAASMAGQNGTLAESADVVLTINRIPEPTLIPFDIRPGSDLNRVNLNSRGMLPVAVLATDDFSVLDIDLDSLLFGDPRLAGTLIRPRKSSYKDVDDDGSTDLTLKFGISDLIEHNVLGPLTTEGLLTGELLDGTQFMGSDAVQITPTIVPVTPELNADFDDDGDVDGDDFLLWGLSLGVGDGGDADDDGDTDGDDFLIWQVQFHSGGGSANSPMPEPASIVLLVAALVGAVFVSARQDSS